MGTVDLQFATELRDRLGLKRAIETGTFRGETARALGGIFASVTTIELSADLHRRAAIALSDMDNLLALQGDSASRLTELTEPECPTLYFLDGHWSGGSTGGADDQCPVLAEIAALGSGHADDCVLIDDAALFASAPPPPHKVEQWPTLLEVFDAIREKHPDHLITVLNDQIIAVPARARPAIDAYGLRLQPKPRRRDHLPGIWRWIKQTAVVGWRSRRPG